MALIFEEPTPMEKISDAILDALQSITTKKEELRRAFENLQIHYSSPLSSVHLQWSEIDSHFSSLQTSLETHFRELQNRPPPPPPPPPKSQPQQQEQGAPSQSIKQIKKKLGKATLSNLKEFCIKMDGIGLRDFIAAYRKQIKITREDVLEALEFAPDPAKLVLDSLQGFLELKKSLPAIRTSCILLLQGISDSGPEIWPEIQKEAKDLAVEWKGKVKPLLYVQLVSAYGLKDGFSMSELVDMLVSISITNDDYRKHAMDLCKELGLESKVPDIIEKLKSKRRQVEAVTYAYAFELVDMFPPVVLLEAYLEDSKQSVKEILVDGQYSYESQYQAFAKEKSCLKLAVKCIQEYKLDSQFSVANLEEQIQILSKKKPDMKRRKQVAGVTVGAKPRQQNKNKRPQQASSNPANTNMSSYASTSPNHLQQRGYVPQHVALSSPDHAGFVGTHPSLPHHPSEFCGPYNMATGYGGYGFHPAYGYSFGS